MRKIKNFEQFHNEEVNWRNIAKGAALSGGLLLGDPAIGQEIDSDPIIGKYGVHAMEEEEGKLVRDRRIIDGFKTFLQDPRITIEKEYTLVNVFDLGDFDNYRVVLRQKNARPGQAEQEVYINKKEFEDYIAPGEGKISLNMYYQFIEDEQYIPAELRGLPDNRKKPDNSDTYRL